MDDDTKALMHLLALTLDGHTKALGVIAENQAAILGVLQRQQAEGSKTGDALQILTASIKLTQADVKAQREVRKQQQEQARKAAGLS